MQKFLALSRWMRGMFWTPSISLALEQLKGRGQLCQLEMKRFKMDPTIVRQKLRTLVGGFLSLSVVAAQAKPSNSIVDDGCRATLHDYIACPGDDKTQR